MVIKCNIRPCNSLLRLRRHNLFVHSFNDIFLSFTSLFFRHTFPRSFRHVSTPIFIISGQLDMNSFNELTCGVKPQDPEYEIYTTGNLGSISSTCLRPALMRKDPESAKSCLTRLSLFALLGSARIKAARKMLVKLTPVYLCLMTTLRTPNFVRCWQVAVVPC